ncbi:hypothetical protein [Bradyrhizobium sp. SZCCHNS3053]|uniref:hypothetical protein n=1 Tax=Bradyrhizobium sp. SZCCHNS3053 TaxID=3057322 RepID=UPI0029163F42|nr:hypothetical protein [Bradyrhizobium sp. SZCCHNS3053]
MSILFSLLGMIPGLASGFMSWLNKKTDADLEKFKTAVGGDVTLNVAELRYKVEVARMAAQMRSDDREHWFTAWMVPVAFAVLFFHVAAVVFDSIPLLGHEVGSWGIAALPAPYDTMQQQIVLTICGVAGVSSLKKIFSR